MATILSYKANCSATLVTATGTEYPIYQPYIKSIVTEYKYFNHIMPCIYLILDVDENLYNTIIDNATEGTITLRCVNYDTNSGTGFQKEIVSDSFIYFIPSKYNYTKDIQDPNIDDSMYYEHIVLGLIKTTHIYINKQSYNGVYEETDTEKLLAKFTEGLPNLMQDELESNTEYESFLLPPQSTRSGAIDYLFTRDPFFKTNYLFFLDFDKTYLLNTSGMAREVSKATILFQIEDINEKSAYYTGFSKDLQNGTYIVYVNMANSNISINTTTDKTYNQIVSTYTDEVTTVDSDISKMMTDTSNKQEFVARANEMGANIRKQIMDNTAVTINISKKNMDSTLITPDKRYQINYDKYSSYNGTYLLLYKREIFVRAGEAFDTTCIIGLQRIADQNISSK